MRELNKNEIMQVEGGTLRSPGVTGIVTGVAAWGAGFAATSALAGAIFMTGGTVLVIAGAAYYLSKD